jgi:hypothetical protein
VKDQCAADRRTTTTAPQVEPVRERSIHDGPFFFVTIETLDCLRERLDVEPYRRHASSAILVYMALAEMAQHRRAESFEVKRRTLGGLTKLSPRVVKLALRILETSRVIRRERAGFGVPHTITLTACPPPEVGPLMPHPAKEVGPLMPHSGSFNAPPRTPSNKIVPIPKGGAPGLLSAGGKNGVPGRMNGYNSVELVARDKELTRVRRQVDEARQEYEGLRGDRNIDFRDLLPGDQVRLRALRVAIKAGEARLAELDSLAVAAGGLRCG